jgi:hypothetical protein
LKKGFFLSKNILAGKINLAKKFFYLAKTMLPSKIKHHQTTHKKISKNANI